MRHQNQRRLLMLDLLRGASARPRRRGAVLLHDPRLDEPRRGEAPILEGGPPGRLTSPMSHPAARGSARRRCGPWPQWKYWPPSAACASIWTARRTRTAAAHVANLAQSESIRRIRSGRFFTRGQLSRGRQPGRVSAPRVCFVSVKRLAVASCSSWRRSRCAPIARASACAARSSSAPSSESVARSASASLKRA
jgi:hypothetical protein